MGYLDFEHGGNIYGIKKKAPGRIIDFSANINPLGLPPEVKRAVCENFNRILHYPDPEAKGITGKISKSWKIKEENILVGNGSIELIYLITSCFKPKTTLIPAPTFSEYERAARTVKSKVKLSRFKERDGFSLNISHISSSDMLFFCNPNNPTGNLILKTGRISNKFPAKLVVIDEAFMDFLPNQQDYTLIPQAIKSKKIIVLRTLTKFFALPGLRIGYLVAHRNIVNKLKQRQVPWSVNSFAQLAAELVLTDKEYIKKTRQLVGKERAFLFTEIAGIKKLNPYPSEANFLLVKVNNAKLTSSLLMRRLIRRGILIRDCANFRGLSNKFIRVAVRSRNENLKLIKALREAV